MNEDKSLWTANHELQPVAAELIAEHHKHLLGLTIEYLFFAGERRSGGRLVLGKTKKANEELCEFAGHHIDFVITLSHDWWKVSQNKERMALMDHELCHCSISPDSGEPIIIAHDVEEFTEVIRRNGIWKDDLRNTAEAFGQLNLGFEDGS